MKNEHQNAFSQVSFFDFIKRALEIVKNPLPFHHDNFEKKGDTFQLHLGFNNKIVFSRNAAFLQNLLNSMHQVIHEELSEFPRNKKIDVAPYFGSLAFQVVAKSLFSGEVEESTIIRLQEGN